MIRGWLRNTLLGPVKEIIGRTFYTGRFWHYKRTKSMDATEVDAAFWDNLRAGLVSGYEMGALFCKPICEIKASWMLGRGLTLRLADSPSQEGENERAEYTNQLLTSWWGSVHASMISLLEDLLALGDQYAAINPDGSLAVIPLHTVEPEFDLTDPHKMTKCTVTTRLDDFTIIDEYNADSRIQTIKKHGEGESAVVSAEAFVNPIGRLSIVHFANDRGPNEYFGRPDYEALLPIFAHYDDLLLKMVDGGKLMGNPIPTVTGVEDTKDVINANETEDTEPYTDKDGNIQERVLIRLDRDAFLIIGKGGDFEFKAPNPDFPQAVRSILKGLFLLIMDHTHIPEFMWGGAIASSRASAEAQLPPFIRYIDGKRTKLQGVGGDEILGVEAQGGLLELTDIWLRMRRLVDVRVIVGPVDIRWPALTEADETERREWVKMLKGELGLITDETAVQQADLVADAAEEVRRARDDTAAQEFAYEQELRRRAATWVGTQPKPGQTNGGGTQDG